MPKQNFGPWSEEECELFKRALAITGAGEWIQVASYMHGLRDNQQCQSHWYKLGLEKQRKLLQEIQNEKDPEYNNIKRMLNSTTEWFDRPYPDWKEDTQPKRKNGQ